MKKILITGPTGFIGSHLIPYLTQQQYEIRAALRNTSKPLSPNVTPILVGEIDGNTDWKEALEGVDTVIHLAARAHILDEKSLNPEAEFFKTNAQGTANLVQQSIGAGVKHFIFISSIGAMATLSNQTLTENSPCQPDTPYGRSKLQAEQTLIEQASASSMNWTIIRPTLVYGKGNPGNMERLIKLIQKGIPLPFGAIENRRSLVFVGNLTSAILTCLTHPQANNQIFLVTDGEDLSTPQLIRKIAHYLELPCYLMPVPPAALKLAGRLGDFAQLLLKRPLTLNSATVERLIGCQVVDSSHIRKTLKWQPPFTPDEGLKQTLHNEALHQYF